MAAYMDREQPPKQLQESARRVQDYLHQRGLNLTVIELPGSTRTAQDAADNVGCSVAQIAKSIIFRNKIDHAPILVIAAGSNRVDTKKIEKISGIKLGRADGTFVKEQVGFAIGGVPPAGHKYPLQTFLDPALKQHTTIWAAGGTPRALFKLSPDDLARLTNGTWVELAED
jgi:prolyl-tRNA editing enzyme YbaK/EbsC (Cys-tRNA(Pro) deacylase)